MVHLWTLKIDDEKPKPEALTSGTEFSVGGFHWSPDSKRIAFSATRDPDLSSSATSDIYVVRLSDKYVKKLVDAPGPDRNPIWSPDGSQLAYESGREYSFLQFARRHHLRREGGKRATHRRKRFDEDATPDSVVGCRNLFRDADAENRRPPVPPQPRRPARSTASAPPTICPGWRRQFHPGFWASPRRLHLRVAEYAIPQRFASRPVSELRAEAGYQHEGSTERLETGHARNVSVARQGRNRHRRRS